MQSQNFNHVTSCSYMPGALGQHHRKSSLSESSSDIMDLDDDSVRMYSKAMLSEYPNYSNSSYQLSQLLCYWVMIGQEIIPRIKFLSNQFVSITTLAIHYTDSQDVLGQTSKLRADTKKKSSIKNIEYNNINWRREMLRWMPEATSKAV
uniref:Uncharacterized protein n=1 Tax=Glossina pallidipes TaxID=7398 RepID=A0A1B0ADN0_GLOPL